MYSQQYPNAVIESGTAEAGKVAAFFHGSEKFRCIDDNGTVYEIFLTRVTVDSVVPHQPVEVSLTAIVCNVDEPKPLGNVHR